MAIWKKKKKLWSQNYVLRKQDEVSATLPIFTRPNYMPKLEIPLVATGQIHIILKAKNRRFNHYIKYFSLSTYC